MFRKEEDFHAKHAKKTQSTQSLCFNDLPEPVQPLSNDLNL
jgi:hypothetical protein